MKPLRITQRNDEPADIWAMRAYTMALPHFSDDALRAMAGWIESHSRAELARRAALHPPAQGGEP